MPGNDIRRCHSSVTTTTKTAHGVIARAKCQRPAGAEAAEPPSWCATSVAHTFSPGTRGTLATGNVATLALNWQAARLQRTKDF